MNRALLLNTVAVVCFGWTVSAFSAEPAKPVAAASTSAAPGCSTDILSFSETMRKSGNWIDGSTYGYGYPVDGYGYGYDYPMRGYASAPSFTYLDARPGYEIRNLITSANILAEHGQQQACEAVLATTRTIYAHYAADFPGRDGWMGGEADWRQRQIASAVWVSDATTAVRSDRLIDTDVRDAHGEALGSVHDLVIDPKTGKIGYVILARGGLFGFDQTYVPVPWNDFKITQNANLLVLDTIKSVVSAAPMATDAQFRSTSHFADERQKVDAYWTAHIPTRAASN